MPVLGAESPISLLSLNLSSFLLLFLQCLSKLVAYSYHSLMFLGYLSVSMNFFWITLFISLLNSFTKDFSSYLLSLLNFYTNFFIVLLSCSTFFDFVTFIILLSCSSNYLFKFIKNSPIIVYSNAFTFKFFKIFFFQISANSPCTYDTTY